MRPFTSILIRSGFATAFFAATLSAQEPKPFTLQQILSAPYASLLTAAPTGPLFAWTEDAEGRHNLLVGGKDMPARQLTHNTEDDAQDISQLAWSPDAKFIAYTFGAPSGADGKPANPAHLQRPTPVEVIIQPVDGGAPIVVGEGRSPLFTRDGKSLLFVRGGQIWIDTLPGSCSSTLPTVQPASGAELTELPVCDRHFVGVSQLVFDRGTASSLTLSPDGQTLAFISRRREANEPSHSFLALYTFATHTLTFPAPSTGNDSAPAFSPDGKQLAWIRTPFTDFPEFANPRTSATPWSIQMLDLVPCTPSSTCHPERSEGPASPAGSRTVYQPAPNTPGSVLPDPGGHDPYLLWTADHRVIFYSNADGWEHLYAIKSDGTTPATRLTPGNADTQQAIFDPRIQRLYFVSNFNRDDRGDTDRSHIMMYQFANGTNQTLGVEPRTGGSGIETNPAVFSGDLAALVGDVEHPMYPAFIGRPEGRNPAPISPLRSSLPEGYPSSLVTPQQIIFPSTDNLQIHSQLFLPKNLDPHTKHPAILFLHGGPMRQMLLGYPAMDYYSNAYAMNQYLASRGFIVLSVNYRCGIGYGLNFHQCEGQGATGAKEYDDVLAAAKYLQSRPDVDVKRIGLWGGSYGGYLTALGLARNSDIFATGVDFHGVHDWNLEDNASDWKQGSFAQQDAIAAKALASSPLGDISKWRSPVLLIHGDNDPDVAYAQTPHLADALRARNASLPPTQQVDVQELIFPDELHGFLLHRDWIAAYTATAAFFERILKP